MNSSHGCQSAVTSKLLILFVGYLTLARIGWRSVLYQQQSPSTTHFSLNLGWTTELALLSARFTVELLGVSNAMVSMRHLSRYNSTTNLIEVPCSSFSSFLSLRQQNMPFLDRRPILLPASWATKIIPEYWWNATSGGWHQESMRSMPYPQ